MAQINGSLVREYFGSFKSIQPSYNFLVQFNDVINNQNTFMFEQLESLVMAKSDETLYSSINFEPYYAKRVSIPQTKFKKEHEARGSLRKTFPILDDQGYEFEIDFEEDKNGRISFLIQWLQSRILTGDGFYHKPNDVPIKSVSIDVIDAGGVNVSQLKFHNVYYLQAQNVTYSYSENSSVIYTITFHSDFYSIKYIPEVEI